LLVSQSWGWGWVPCCRRALELTPMGPNLLGPLGRHADGPGVSIASDAFGRPATSCAHKGSVTNDSRLSLDAINRSRPGTNGSHLSPTPFTRESYGDSFSVGVLVVSFLSLYAAFKRI